MQAWLIFLGSIATLWTGTGLLHAQLAGMDAGAKAQDIATWDDTLLEEWGRSGAWLRLRAAPNPADLNAMELMGREAQALRKLGVLGFQPVLHLRWNEKSWQMKVRSGGGQRLPLDLREIFRRTESYGRAYGATGTAFEIENEPDISFVQENPETYMAFQKAAYLGIKRGAVDADAVSDKPKALNANSEMELRADRLGPKAAVSSLIYRRQLGRRGGVWESLNLRAPTAYRLPLTAERDVDAPRVVMAPLALPPGPYFEQLVANGLFSYTDAFNYHYYGYADDFSGTYRQFEDAVTDVGRGHRTPPFPNVAGFGAPTLQRKTLPVLLTEYGYGSLSGEDRDTVEGRLRQWRWFKSVGEQIRKLRIAGPMAFYLPPYLENKSLEFGLTVPARRNAESEDVGQGLRTPPNESAKAGFGDPALQLTAGGLSYAPTDFGLKKPAPWMNRIGQRFGENEATPALAWLLEEGARKPYRPRNWTVRVPEPSPVVIDFIAGQGLIQQKRYGGYVAIVDRDERSTDVGRDRPITLRLRETGSGDPTLHAKFGSGQFVLYNFSDVPMQGRLEVVHGRDLLANAAAVEREWTLEPMARVLVPVALAVPAHEFTRHELALRFTTSPVHAAQHLTLNAQPHAAVSVFSTFFYPEASGMKEEVWHDFERDGSGLSSDLRNRALLKRRPLAVEEPRLEPVGRWNVTLGVNVEETANRTWRFHIVDFPLEPNKPAMAELVLPDDFVFPDGGMMQFSYRLVQPAGATLANGKYFEAYFRTSNGNLYQVWPRQYAVAAWNGYTEANENYTMAFYGRANLPWRFRDNRPVALVFFFRPGRAALPATYEVKDARIVRLTVPSS